MAVGAGISIGTMACLEIDALPAANLWMTHTSWSQLKLLANLWRGLWARLAYLQEFKPKGCPWTIQ